MGWPRAEPVPSWCLWGCTAPLSHQTLSLGTQPGVHPSSLGASIPTQPLGRDTCFPWASLPSAAAASLGTVPVPGAVSLPSEPPPAAGKGSGGRHCSQCQLGRGRLLLC